MTTYTAISEIKTGKCDFNRKDAKGFCVTLGKYANAILELDDTLNEINNSIANRKGMIEQNNADIAKLEEKKTIVRNATVQDLQDENTKLYADIEEYKTAKQAAQKVKNDRLKDGQALVNREMYSAYVEYIDSLDSTKLVVALANWLEQNGVEAHIETVQALVAFMGKKNSTRKQRYQRSILRTAQSYATWRDGLLRDVCDFMIQTKAITPRKFTFKVKKWEKRAK